MSFFQFCSIHKSEIWGVAASSLFLISEYLGTSDKFESSSIFQFVKTWLKGQSDQAPKP